MAEQHNRREQQGTSNPEQERQEQTGQEDASDASEVGRPADSAKETGTVRGHEGSQSVRRSA